MNYRGLPIPLVQRVGYTDAQQYALSTGWQRVQGVKGDMAVYRRPDSKRWEVIIPQDRTFSDYALRMAEAIASLSDFERIENERRTAPQLLNDLLLPASDVLRFSLEGASVQDGTAPLGEALNLLAGAKKALVASACTVVHSQKFHPRMSRTEAEQFINKCRLGQTEQGSFVTTFICPLDGAHPEEPQLLPAAPNSPEGFTRKVTRTLVQSLRRVLEAVNADQIESLVNPPAGELVISANLCEALLEMQPATEESLLAVYPTWARTIPPPANVPSKVRFSKEHFPIVEEVARRLRPSHQPKLEQFVGLIDTLDGKPGPDNRPAGEVILAFLDEGEEKLSKARLYLAVDDYAKAIRAHAVTSVVTVKGVLHRGPRISVIRDYRDFEVIDAQVEQELTTGLVMHETPPPYNPPKLPPDARQ